jgi:YrbI family 3-deoxy-D-manno-octulosonate 8-phosphate phosphatase
MIKLLILDFDGVFTDGKIFFDSYGKVMKFYNVKDGTGIKLLQNKNIKIGVISGYKENKSQLEILNHLKIDLFSLNDKDKVKTANEWCRMLDINIEKEVAFMGDDINDIELMKIVKMPSSPSNAHKSCKKVCEWISSYNGGEGCIRQLCEHIIEINNSISV